MRLVKPILPTLRWIIILLLTIVAAFELIQTAFATVSAEESTAVTFFAAIASLIVGLPNKRSRTLTSLMVLLGSIASVAFAGLWSSEAATAAAFFVVCGLGASLVLGREGIYPLLLPARALSYRAQLTFLSFGLKFRIMADRVSLRLPILKPVISAMVRAVNFLACTTQRVFGIVAEAGRVSVLSAHGLYRSRASVLIWCILFASVALPSRAVRWGSEYVSNGSFDQGFDGWTVPSLRYPSGSVSNGHWYLPGESCLAMTAYSRRGLSYDRVAVFQPLNVELSWGTWIVSGYMGNVDVWTECDAMATSITIVLRDNAGETRYLKYAVLVKGEIASNSTEGIVEVGRGRNLQVDFSRDLFSNIQEVWGIPFVVGWRVIGVELLVEFRNNWGDEVHLEAIFDDVSLRRESDARWLRSVTNLSLAWTVLIALLISGASTGVRSRLRSLKS